MNTFTALDSEPTRAARAARASILAHLRTLRGSLAQARDALMHYSEDRLDRDQLEPAARRVDELMNMFAGESRDPGQGSVWVTEILGGVENVTNPKAAAALSEARVEIAVLLEVMDSEEKRTHSVAS
jgi:hypothetical protein